MGTAKMKGLILCVFVIVLATSDELKDLSSADVAPKVSKETKVSTAEKSNLGESEGFAGALMTSGSFTMMAAGAGFEEESELGEGEGFAGALMTSGSFTMMAAGAGFEE